MNVFTFKVNKKFSLFGWLKIFEKVKKVKEILFLHFLQQKLVSERWIDLFDELKHFWTKRMANSTGMYYLISKQKKSNLSEKAPKSYCKWKKKCLIIGKTNLSGRAGRSYLTGVRQPVQQLLGEPVGGQGQGVHVFTYKTIG